MVACTDWVHERRSRSLRGLRRPRGHDQRHGDIYHLRGDQRIPEVDQEAVVGRHKKSARLREKDIRLWWVISGRSDIRTSLTFIDHAKDMLENAQQEATKQYTRLVQTINKDAGLSTRLPKNSAVLTLKPTFLCLQCPTVATSEQRDKHDKSHRFCKKHGNKTLARTDHEQV